MNTIGERVQYCRKLLNLTRHELIAEYKEITVSTLERWENNKVQIKEKNILSFIKFLCVNGLQITVEWLRYGAGTPPSLFTKTNVVGINFDDMAHLVAQQIASSSLNFIYVQINNNFFEPILKYGDYAGGIISDKLSLLNGKLCFCKNNNNTTVGFLNYIDDDNFSLKDSNKNDIKEFTHEDNNIFGEINWMMRRFD